MILAINAVQGINKLMCQRTPVGGYQAALERVCREGLKSGHLETELKAPLAEGKYKWE